MKEKGFASVIIMFLILLLIFFFVVFIYVFQYLLSSLFYTGDVSQKENFICKPDETELQLSDNEPQTYKDITIYKYPSEKNIADLRFKNEDEIVFKQINVRIDDDPLIYDFATLYVPHIENDFAIVCLSDTKIKFQDIVTKEGVRHYLPAFDTFDWDKGLQNTRRWKTYDNPDIGITFKYPDTWYGLDPNDDPDNILVYPPCEGCGGATSGLFIGKDSNEEQLSPEQYYVNAYCEDEYNKLRDINACHNFETEYSILGKPKNLEGFETYFENGSPGAGFPGVKTIIKNSNGELIIINSDGVDDDVMKTIISTLVIK